MRWLPGILVVSFALGLVLLAPFIHASFVCGEVIDYRTISASWLQVNISYAEKPNDSISCVVSPGDNRYCCDVLEIKSVPWGIGKILNASIRDIEHGLIAGPAQLAISGEGYDLFPAMNLSPIFEFSLPNSTLFVNQTEVFFNVSTREPFNSIRFLLVDPLGNSTVENVCTNCTQAEFHLRNLSFGINQLTFFFSDGKDIVNKSFNLSLTESLTFRHEISCEDCSQNRVRSNQNVSVSVIINSSHPIQANLQELYPSEWTYHGESLSYNQDYNYLTWTMDGTSFKANYLVTSPKLILSVPYFFQTIADPYIGTPHRVVVSRLIGFDLFAFLFERVIEERMLPLWGQVYSRISPQNPAALVSFGNNSTLAAIIITPTENMSNIGVIVYNVSRSSNSPSGFLFDVWSNIPQDKVSTLRIRFKVANELSNSSENSRLAYEKIDGQWLSLNASKYSSDGSYSYYESWTNHLGKFAIAGSSNG